MQSSFSPKLIKKCQNLIYKRAGIHISDNQAVIYLDKLAQLMGTVVQITKKVETEKLKIKHNGKNH